jgi:membrane protein YqaA with SNARE-associated domain
LFRANNLGRRSDQLQTIAVLLLSSWAYSIFDFFRRLGPFGLLLLSALDSSFLVMPLGNDLLLVALVTSSGGSWITIAYVMTAAAGSMLGVLSVDVLMRTAGEKGLARFVRKKQIRKIKSRMDKHAGWALFLAALIPPPFPFTAVVMTASSLQYSRKKLLSLVFAGRLLRFTLIAILAIYFGQRLLALAESRAVAYFVYALIAIAVVGSTLSIIKWFKK